MLVIDLGSFAVTQPVRCWVIFMIAVVLLPSAAFATTLPREPSQAGVRPSGEQLTQCYETKDCTTIPWNPPAANCDPRPLLPINKRYEALVLADRAGFGLPTVNPKIPSDCEPGSIAEEISACRDGHCVEFCNTINNRDDSIECPWQGWPRPRPEKEK